LKTSRFRPAVEEVMDKRFLDGLVNRDLNKVHPVSGAEPGREGAAGAALQTGLGLWVWDADGSGCRAAQARPVGPRPPLPAAPAPTLLPPRRLSRDRSGQIWPKTVKPQGPFSKAALGRMACRWRAERETYALDTGSGFLAG